MSGPSGGQVLEGGLRALLDAPQRVFHAVLGLVGVGLVWTGSLPGVPLIPLMGLAWLAASGALIWFLKLGGYLVRRRRGVARPSGRWFLLAPVGGLLVTLVLVSGVAFDARWALSQSAFDDAVTAATDPARDPVELPRRLGLYRVLGQPLVIGDAVFFHHPSGGGIFDDAGFAYLPGGVTPEVEGSFESLRTEQIDGPWHRWWSSW